MSLSKQVYLLRYGQWKKHASDIHAGTCLPVNRTLLPHELTDDEMCIVVVETHDGKHTEIESGAHQTLPHHSNPYAIRDRCNEHLGSLGIRPETTWHDVYMRLAKHHPAFHPRNL